METILQEAQRIVFGDREDGYGHPRDDMARIARHWNALLYHQLASPIKDWQVPMMMMLVKMSRRTNAAKRDDWTDMAGYAEVGARVDGFDA